MAIPAREVDVEVLPKGTPPPPPRPPGAPGNDPLAALIAKLMDSFLKVPGTNVKVGLDPIIGLIPGVGSGVSGLISMLLITRAVGQGVPHHILVRMVGNVIVNAIIDSIPVAGDVFSVFYRSNDRNYALLQRYAGTRKKTTTKDWLVLGALFLGVIAVMVCAFFGALYLLGMMWRAMTGS